MKRTLIHSMLIATAAILVASCDASGLKISVAGQEGVKVTISAAAETRTAIDESDPSHIHSYWNNGDVLGVWAGSVSGAPTEFSNTAETAAAASFSGEIPDFGVSTTLYAVYPKARVVNPAANPTSVQINFRGTQTPPSKDTYDPASEVLGAQPKAVSAGIDNSVFTEMCFGRATSTIKVVFTGSLPTGVLGTDLLKKFIFSAGPAVSGPTGEGIFLAGNVEMTEDGNLTNHWTTATNQVTVTPSSDIMMENAQLYLTVAPCVIPSSTKLVFQIYTEDKYIRKEVNAPSQIDLSSGSFVTLNVSLNGLVADILPEVDDNPSILPATYQKDLEGDTYSATINGRYTATNVTEYNKVTHFFYYKVNGEKQKTSELFYSSNNTEDYGFTITGLSKNDYVEYMVVARVGDSSLGNKKSAWSDRFYIDPDPVESWSALAAWEPTGAATNLHPYNATSGTGDAYLYGTKKIKTAANQFILTGICKDEYAVFHAEVPGYEADTPIRLRFSTCYSNLEKEDDIIAYSLEEPSFSIAWSADNEHWTAEENELAVPYPNANRIADPSKIYSHSFSSVITDVYVRLTYTRKSRNSKSVYLGKVYLEIMD